MPIFLSFFLMWVFQWFLISLSVLPGSRAAILDHLDTHHAKPEFRIHPRRERHACLREEQHAWESIPVAELLVEINDELLLVVGEEAALEVGAQVVGPAEAAALAAPEQPRELGDEPPAAMAVREEEGDELLVLLRRPRPLLQPHLRAARLPAHVEPAWDWEWRQHQHLLQSQGEAGSE
jgi:hypothetical protein